MIYLVDLDLGSNQLSNLSDIGALPPSVAMMPCSCCCHVSRFDALCAVMVTDWPPQLRQLDLSYNAITELPWRMFEPKTMPMLEMLQCHHNQLTSIPNEASLRLGILHPNPHPHPEVGQMACLERADFSHNLLEAAPPPHVLP